jgi:hypothetical protein
MFFLCLTNTLDLYVVSTCVLTEDFKVILNLRYDKELEKEGILPKTKRSGQDL